MDREDGMEHVSDLQPDIGRNFITNFRRAADAEGRAHRVARVARCTNTESEEASAPCLVVCATVGTATIDVRTNWGRFAP